MNESDRNIEINVSMLPAAIVTMVLLWVFGVFDKPKSSCARCEIQQAVIDLAAPVGIAPDSPDPFDPPPFDADDPFGLEVSQ